MMDELEPNLYEQEMRRLADFGHTFSPTLETRSAHRFSHGEAVAIDMLLSTAIAVGRSICAPAVFDRALAIYRAIGLPVTDALCTPETLAHAMNETRRTRAGDLNLVVPSSIGSGVFLQHVGEDELLAAIDLVCTA
jgi:3-dehydroquinate synthase